MFGGFEVSGGQINPDLLDFSSPLYFPVEFFLETARVAGLSWAVGISANFDTDADAELRPTFCRTNQLG